MSRRARSLRIVPFPRSPLVRLVPALRSVALACLLAASAGCGGGDDGGGGNPVGPGPGSGGSGPMSATIDGQAWAAVSPNLFAATVPGVPGAFVIQGSKILSSTDALTVQFLLYNIPGPGTYPLGTGPTVVGGLANVAQAAFGYGTPLSGSAGTIMITVLTTTRIAGTFEFVATPLFGVTTGTRTVSNGQFDLTLSSGGSLPPLPPKAGSRVAASLGGTPYNASTVVAGLASGALILSTSTTDFMLSMTIGSVAGTGTYPITDTDFTRNITLIETATNAMWGPTTGISGSVTITTLTADRAVGTFDVTLPPVPGSGATSPIVVTAGAFDVGLN